MVSASGNGKKTFGSSSFVYSRDPSQPLSLAPAGHPSSQKTGYLLIAQYVCYIFFFIDLPAYFNPVDGGFSFQQINIQKVIKLLKAINVSKATVGLRKFQTDF